MPEDSAEQGREAFRRALDDQIRAKQPRLREALAEDVRVFALYRQESYETASWGGLLRAVTSLSWRTDAFFSLALYRVRTWLAVRRVPLLPDFLHHVAMSLSQLNIGKPVVVQPGVYVPHGQVVIDGIVEVGRGAVLRPWITIGLVEGEIVGPKLGALVMVGTGAKILGPIRIGSNVQIGANAVVLRDVPDGATAVGVPARVVPAPAEGKAGEAAGVGERASAAPPQTKEGSR